MLKRLCCITICCLLITGCSKQEKKVETAASSKEKESLVYKDGLKGDGNEDGYYHLVERDIKIGTITNICYFDYQSKQEIYLCDKPECKHEEESCTSYLPILAMNSALFVYQDNIYIIQDEGTTISFLGDQENQGAKIYRMDLDGKNHEEFASLPKEYSFLGNTMVVGDSMLYLVLAKTDMVSMENSTMQVNKDEKLFGIDINTGKIDIISDFKDCQIIGANKRDIIISKVKYSEDVDALLEKKEYQRYDQVTMQATFQYHKFNIDTKTFNQEISPESTLLATYYDENLYYLKEQEIHQTNIDTGKDTTLCILEEPLSYNISTILDQHILIDAWSTKNEEDEYLKSFALNVTTNVLSPFTLVTNAPKEPVNIIGQNTEYYFVKYNHDAHLEKTWAGTMQYQTDAIYCGLIKKEDYWNSKNSFIKISSFSKEY